MIVIDILSKVAARPELQRPTVACFQTVTGLPGAGNIGG